MGKLSGLIGTMFNFLEFKRSIPRSLLIKYYTKGYTEEGIVSILLRDFIFPDDIIGRLSDYIEDVDCLKNYYDIQDFQRLPDCLYGYYYTDVGNSDRLYKELLIPIRDENTLMNVINPRTSQSFGRDGLVKLDTYYVEFKYTGVKEFIRGSISGAINVRNIELIPIKLIYRRKTVFYYEDGRRWE